MDAHAVISFQGVKKTYKGELGRKATVALVGLSFHVDKSEVFGIIGPNGAGKSTALKILMGLVKASAGTVTLSGLYPADPAAHRVIGYLPENPCLYDNLTAREHLQFAGRVAGMDSQGIKKRAEQLLDLVKLSHAAAKPIRGYSKGMTQRAALAYALFHGPEILILDEPMSGLDPLGRQLVVDIIRQYHAEGHTILFCSHILNDVERMCDRIGIMHQGQLAAVTTPDELEKMPIPAHRRDATPLEAFFMETVGDKTSPPVATKEEAN